MDTRTIAARLIALLPHRVGINMAPRKTLPDAGALNMFHAAVYVIIINLVFLAIAFGSQYFTANHQPPLHASFTHAEAAKTAAPKVPMPDFQQVWMTRYLAVINGSFRRG